MLFFIDSPDTGHLFSLTTCCLERTVLISDIKKLPGMMKDVKILSNGSVKNYCNS